MGFPLYVCTYQKKKKKNQQQTLPSFLCCTKPLMLRKTRRRGSGAEPLSRPARFTGSRRCPLAPVKANRAAQNAGRGGPLRPPAPPHGRPLAPAPLTAPPAAPAAATARGRPPGAAGRCSAGGGGGAALGRRDESDLVGCRRAEGGRGHGGGAVPRSQPPRAAGLGAGRLGGAGAASAKAG